LEIIVQLFHISVKNPPPICAGIPHIDKLASVCIDIFNVTWTEKVYNIYITM